MKIIIDDTYYIEKEDYNYTLKSKKREVVNKKDGTQVEEDKIKDLAYCSGVGEALAYYAKVKTSDKFKEDVITIDQYMVELKNVCEDILTKVKKVK